MKRNALALALVTAAVGAVVLVATRADAPALGPEGPSERAFAFTYEVLVEAPPAGKGPVDLFVPLAQADSHQEILSREIEATIPGTERTETEYGNRFWHGHLGVADGEPIRVAVRYVVRRKVSRNAKAPARAPSPEKRETLQRFLAANRRVPVTGPLIDAIRAELKPVDGSAAARARAIYNYVIDNMEYKKVGTGWGNGDTFWACTAKYGNCTDFHALFLSLARAEGIPARFEIGFPIPEDRSDGAVAGYHCWVQFYLPERGWVPIDASEAWKNPQRRDLYFGTHPADRILFTVGRDLELGEGHSTGPLNYFIYPHAEVAGQHYSAVRAQFRYRLAPQPGERAKTGSKERRPRPAGV